MREYLAKKSKVIELDPAGMIIHFPALQEPPVHDMKKVQFCFTSSPVLFVYPLNSGFDLLPGPYLLFLSGWRPLQGSKVVRLLCRGRRHQIPKVGCNLFTGFYNFPQKSRDKKVEFRKKDVLKGPIFQTWRRKIQFRVFSLCLFIVYAADLAALFLLLFIFIFESLFQIYFFSSPID